MELQIGGIKKPAVAGAIVNAPPEAIKELEVQRKCLEDLDDNFMRLGQSCLITNENKWYLKFGYPDMENYAKGLLLTQKMSTIRYWMQLAKFRNALGEVVSDDDWQELGRTKARILVQSHPDTGSVPDLVEKYKSDDISVRQMEQDLLHPAQRKKIDTNGKMVWKVMLLDEQWSVINSALDHIRAEAGDDEMSDSRAIELLAADYLAGPADPMAKIESALKSLNIPKDQRDMLVNTLKSALR